MPVCLLALHPNRAWPGQLDAKSDLRDDVQGQLHDIRRDLGQRLALTKPTPSSQHLLGLGDGLDKDQSIVPLIDVWRDDFAMSLPHVPLGTDDIPSKEIQEGIALHRSRKGSRLGRDLRDGFGIGRVEKDAIGRDEEEGVANLCARFVEERPGPVGGHVTIPISQALPIQSPAIAYSIHGVVQARGSRLIMGRHSSPTLNQSQW